MSDSAQSQEDRLAKVEGELTRLGNAVATLQKWIDDEMALRKELGKKLSEGLPPRKALP